jgi:signal transduction histidine kinase
MTAPPAATRATPNSRSVIVAWSALLLVLGAAFAWTSWQAERAREVKAMTALVELGEKSLDAYFTQIESALRVLSEEIRGAGGAPDVKRAGIVLKRFKQAYPDLQIVIVARPDGQVVASSEAAPSAQLPTLASEPSFVLAREELSKGATLSIGRAFLGPISRQWIIPLRYAARDGAGNLQFLVGAGLPLAKPQSFWKDAPLPAGAALGLARDDRYLVSRYPVPAAVELVNVYGKPIAGGTLMAALEQQQFPVTGSVDGRSAVSGIETIFVFRRLAHYPLTFFVANPVANIWAAWRHNVWITYLLMLVLGGGGVAVYRWADQRHAAWEQEREKRLRELEEANRDLESFSHTVAHDLRAPLRHIDGFAHLWRREAGAAAEQSALRYMEKISATAIRMGTLIDDLLAYSRNSRADLCKSAVAVDALVAEIVAQLQPALGARSVEWVIGALPVVRADRNLLRVALFNLLQNAVKYTGTRATARIEVTCVEKDGDAIIAVRDNGVGFDMNFVHKLFNVFQRLHAANEFAGTGIGLANVARIVQRHGGRVWAEGETGRGASFFIALPHAKGT